MKQFCLLVYLLTAYSGFLFSQDIIVKKNGDQTQAKVTEVTETQIKYKTWDNLDGPVYSISTSAVSEIKYQNGKTDVFSNSNPPPQTRSVTPQTPTGRAPKYKGEIIGGSIMTALGPICLIPGAILVIAGVGLNEDTYDVYGNQVYGTGNGYLISGSILIAAGVAFAVAGPILLSRGLYLKRGGRPVTLNLRPIDSKFDMSFRAKINQTKLAGVSLNF